MMTLEKLHVNEVIDLYPKAMPSYQQERLAGFLLLQWQINGDIAPSDVHGLYEAMTNTEPLVTVDYLPTAA